MTKEIPLTRGKVALVDDEDYEWLMQWKWYCTFNKKDGYAARVGPRADGRKVIYMHRVIANTPSGMETDHINQDKLDNRRQNLRICTHAQNNWRNGAYSGSQYKGVYYRTDIGKWSAQLKYGGHRTTIGCFATAEQAARAYDKVARQRFGEFAYLNFPEEI